MNIAYNEKFVYCYGYDFPWLYSPIISVIVAVIAALVGAMLSGELLLPTTTFKVNYDLIALSLSLFAIALYFFWLNTKAIILSSFIIVVASISYTTLIPQQSYIILNNYYAILPIVITVISLLISRIDRPSDLRYFQSVSKEVVVTRDSEYKSNVVHYATKIYLQNFSDETITEESLCEKLSFSEEIKVNIIKVIVYSKKEYEFIDNNMNYCIKALKSGESIFVVLFTDIPLDNKVIIHGKIKNKSNQKNIKNILNNKWFPGIIEGGSLSLKLIFCISLIALTSYYIMHYSAIFSKENNVLYTFFSLWAFIVLYTKVASFVIFTNFKIFFIKQFLIKGEYLSYLLFNTPIDTIIGHNSKDIEERYFRVLQSNKSFQPTANASAEFKRSVYE